MAQRRAYLPSGLGSSQWQAGFPPGGSLISWPGMATSASCVPGSAIATVTPAPGWLICWLSRRHEHAAAAGGVLAGGRQVRHQIPGRCDDVRLCTVPGLAPQNIGGAEPRAGPRGRSLEVAPRRRPHGSPDRDRMIVAELTGEARRYA